MWCLGREVDMIGANMREPIGADGGGETASQLSAEGRGVDVHVRVAASAVPRSRTSVAASATLPSNRDRALSWSATRNTFSNVAATNT
jgi:hypothetical protein